MTVRVLIADDQDLIRTGLKMILDAQPDIDVIGEAADGRQAVALARELRPALLRIGERIARLLVVLPPGLDEETALASVREHLRTPHLVEASRRTIARALAELSQTTPSSVTRE